MKPQGRNRILPIGKLPNDLLARLLRRYIRLDRRVVVGPAVGEDAAAIRFGDRYLIAKTDPITFVSDKIGFYALHINANDLATMGAVPRWFLVTLLLPEGKTTPALVEKIFRQLSKACKTLGVSLCGGHTEITHGIDRPIVIGQMLGEADRGRLIRTSDAKIGDDLLLTKGIAIEGTSIIARRFYDKVTDRFGQKFAQRCKGFLFDPGVSVLRDARVALRAGRVHAMHDPTEGGLSTGLYELAEAARVGLWVEEDRIPVRRETRKVCNAFDLNPLGLIASGSLLLSVHPEDTPSILKALHRDGIEAAWIGHVVSKKKGVLIRRHGRWAPLPRFKRDEIARLFEHK
ncbi:MAG: hydrogenase expression protein [Nitrospirae bacterium]|nr:hydrogenase expression protein [Nitrospirota bacterium]